MDIRLRFGGRPSPGSSGENEDCGTREESISIGSGSVLWLVGEPDGDPSSGSMGELSSMMSWVERFLGARELMTSAGVAKGAPVWVDDGLGVEAANRGVA